MAAYETSIGLPNSVLSLASLTNLIISAATTGSAGNLMSSPVFKASVTVSY